ncbi:MAG TPA: VOC family protein [Chitinophagaceae bacterium]|nr:VOC family protein [Chitinophagaceae bacterium]
MKRRQFLANSAAAALSVLNAHFVSSAIHSMPGKNNTSPLIKALLLQTAAPLDAMRNFYEKTIGLQVLSQTADQLVVMGGTTSITFSYVKNKNSRPFYHFAFNIPENKIYKAFEWQKKRTPLINPRPNNTRDPMKEVVDFSHWNAHSIFFLDPAGNLVEYIARHDLNNATTGDFSPKDILYVSEIAFIVSEVETAGNAFLNELNLKQYRPSSPGFWPIGDEYGLLLMIDKGITWTGHPGQANITDVFNTVAVIEGQEKNWTLTGYPYQVLKG